MGDQVESLRIPEKPMNRMVLWLLLLTSEMSSPKLRIGMLMMGAPISSQLMGMTLFQLLFRILLT